LTFLSCSARRAPRPPSNENAFGGLELNGRLVEELVENRLDATGPWQSGCHRCGVRASRNHRCSLREYHPCILHNVACDCEGRDDGPGGDRCEPPVVRLCDAAATRSNAADDREEGQTPTSGTGHGAGSDFDTAMTLRRRCDLERFRRSVPIRHARWTPWMSAESTPDGHSGRPMAPLLPIVLDGQGAVRATRRSVVGTPEAGTNRGVRSDLTLRRRCFPSGPYRFAAMTIPSGVNVSTKRSSACW